jgi:hypothetical protein
MSDRKSPKPTQCFAGVLRCGWIAPSTASSYARDVRSGLANDYGSWKAAQKQGWRVIRVTIVPAPLVTKEDLDD